MKTTLKNGQLSIIICSKGAELQSIRSGDREYLYQCQDVFWQRQSPILFPIVGALRDEYYTYEGVSYHLGQHGFARDMEWDIIEHIPGSHIVYELRSSDVTRAVYPWDWRLRITYRLVGSELRVSYHVAGTGDQVLRYQIGAHPAFALSSDIGNYSIIIDHIGEIQTERPIGGLLDPALAHTLDLRDGELHLSEELFAQDAVIWRDMRPQKLELISKKDNYRTIFEFIGFNTLALWRQKGAPFICVEPWCGHADLVSSDHDILSKPMMEVLDVGEEGEYEWRVRVGCM